MASLNRVQLIGNLGRDPEQKFTQSGDSVSNFSVACNEVWKDQNGDKQERVEWVRCVSFGKLSEIITKYLVKGSQLYVEGRLQTRKWQDKEGHDVYTTAVVVDRLVMLGGNRREESEEAEDRPARTTTSSPAAKQQSSINDECPF